MPSPSSPTASGFSERVLGTVNQEILPTFADAAFDGNVLAQRLLVGGVKPWGTGPQQTRSVLVQKSSQGGSFSGLDSFSNQAEENTIRLAFDPKGYEQPIVVPGIEESVNATPAGQVSLVSQKIEEAMMNFRDGVATMLYGDGTGNSSKDTNGLDNIVDDGTNATTYGGQSRTTWPALNGNLTTSVGSLTLSHMATQYDNAASTGAPNTKPTLIVCAEDVFRYYEALLTPTVRHEMPSMGMLQVFASGPARPAEPAGMNQGFNALAFRGVPVVADEACPSGEMFFLNENDLAFYHLPGARLENPTQNISVHEDSVYSASPNLGVIQWTGWKVPENQYGIKGDLIMLGNFIAWNPKRHSRSTGITGS